MGELLSVGLDVGTTTTQLIVSRLQVENRAGAFAVPEMAITDREILYRSPVRFTPLKSEQLVDGAAIRELVLQDYAAAGITRESVDTGAIIITGETSRKENAQEVLAGLSGFAGDFVVATAGPDLESSLAARGAGADALSREKGTVLHMDIGGGTSNLALFREGKLVQTGCLNVGGRLIKMEKTGVITYVSPVLAGLTDLKPGDYPLPCQVEALAQLLAQALEMAAGLRPPTALYEKLLTREAGAWDIPRERVTLSFSGGVADCIEKEQEDLAFGDLGPALGRAIRKSLLCRGDFTLGRETIRATVIGAGCHSAQLSGSTVFCRDVALPMKNLPVAVIEDRQDIPGAVEKALETWEAEPVVLAFPGDWESSYAQVEALARDIHRGAGERPVVVCLEADMAKALGQCLCLLGRKSCLCLDRVRLGPGSYLDVGAPVGPALPVVVKTLILSQ